MISINVCEHDRDRSFLHMQPCVKLAQQPVRRNRAAHLVAMHQRAEHDVAARQAGVEMPHAFHILIAFAPLAQVRHRQLKNRGRRHIGRRTGSESGIGKGRRHRGVVHAESSLAHLRVFVVGWMVRQHRLQTRARCLAAQRKSGGRFITQSP